MSNIAASSKTTWKPKIETSGDGTYWVQSETRPGLHYTIDATNSKWTCNCAGKQFKPGSECKHIVAAREYAKTQQAPKEKNQHGTGPTLSREQEELLAKLTEGTARFAALAPKARAIGCAILADDLQSIANQLDAAVSLQRRALSNDATVREAAIAESKLPWRTL